MRTRRQENFRKAAKRELIREILSVTALAAELKMNRSSVHRAINEGGTHTPIAHRKVAKRLRIKPLV